MSVGSIYCVKCGQENSAGNIVCTNCGASLEKSPGGVPGIGGAAQAPKTGSWWGGLNPSIKGAVVMFIAVIVLRTIGAASKGLSCLFSFPVEIALAMAQGVLVSKFALAQKPKYQPKDYPGLAAMSGLYVYLPSLMFGILVGILTGDLILIPLLLLNFIQGFGGIALYMIMASLSAWVYARTGGKGMIGMLAGIGCLATVAVALVLGLVVYLLYAMGSQVLQYFNLTMLPFLWM